MTNKKAFLSGKNIVHTESHRTTMKISTNSPQSSLAALTFLALFMFVPLRGQELARPQVIGPPEPLPSAPWQVLFDEWQPADERISRDGDDFLISGEKVRFFGTSLFGTAVFPDSADAVAIAERIAALGCNAVRISGHDFTWIPDASIFQGPQESQTTQLNEERMRRFDWLIYQLKQRGIYISLVLQSYRQALPGDGVDGWEQLPGQLRVVKFIDPQIEQLDKLVAERILEHVNPFTQTAYKDEAALAWLDVTEDKSLFNAWGSGLFNPGSILSDHYRDMLRERWHEFLRDKYGDDATLNAAWSTTPSSTANQVSNPGFEDAFSPEWQLIVGEGAQAVADPFSSDRAEGELAMRIRINQTAGQIGLIQLRNSSIPLERHQLYKLTFQAKSAEAAQTIAVHLMNPAPPYQQYGLNFVPVDITTEWDEYTLTFRSTDNNELGALLIFLMGGTENDVLFDDVQLRMLAENGLAQGETLEGGIAQPAPTGITLIPKERLGDYMEYLTSLMKNHYERMRSYVRDNIGSEVMLGAPTISTVVNDVYAQSGMDYTAVNAGWDGVRENGTPNWYIDNTSSLAVPWGGLATLVARGSMLDRPHVLSRLLYPFPSAHQHEALSAWPVYAAYQDWDAYFTWTFISSRDNWDAPNIPLNDYYSYANLPHMVALMPSAAAAFRYDLIAEAEDDVAVEQTAEALRYPPLQNGLYWIESDTDPRLPLFRRVGIANFDADFQTRSPQLDIFELSDGNVNTSDLRSDTREISWNADDAYLTVSAPKFKSVSGQFSGELIELDELSIIRQDEGLSGAITWITLDREQTLAAADRSFLTICTRTVNEGAVWNAEANSIAMNWGEGRVMMESMRAELILESERDTMIVTPLDMGGRPLVEPGPVAVANSGGFFRITIDQNAMPALWFGVEMRDAKTTSAAEDNAVENMPTLHILSEHPVRNHALLEVRAGFDGPFRLKLVSMMGAEVAAAEGYVAGGADVVRLNTRGLASGAYVLQLQTASGAATQALIVEP